MDQGTVTVSGLQYYDIDQIFDCGQCFRFTRDSAGAWTGVACRALLTLRQKDPQTLTICAEGAGGGMTQAAFETTFARFLGLQEDYGAIRSDIAARFPVTQPCRRPCLRQRHTHFEAGAVGGAVLLYHLAE